MRANPVGERKVVEHLEALFEEDLHAKRVMSMAHATLGAMEATSLSIHAIGRGMAMARSVTRKHGVKQVDRFLSNSAIDPWELAARWVPHVLAQRTEAVVALDWTEFDADDHSTLVASLVTSHSRTTPLLWKTVQKSALKGQRNAIEDALLVRLDEVVPEGVRVTILADRGFGDQELYRLLGEFGFDYVIRFREIIAVTDETGESRPARDWVPSNGRAKMIKSARVTADGTAVPAVVCMKAKGMKEAWCLATSRVDLAPKPVVDLYARRFTIEESFRDIKDMRFGMGLGAMHVKDTGRRDRLFLISALAIALLTLLGAAGEAAGIDRLFKVNTAKTRQYSLFRQGCDYYDFLPGMRDSWLHPLMENFARLLNDHSVFKHAMGLI
ncbi:MAG: IS4 family transposase [Candidatus Binataceae bacterium]